MSTATYAARRNQNLYKHRESAYLGPISTSFLVIVTIMLLALLYLAQITKTNVFGLTINSLNQKHTELLNQQQDLQIEAARLQSIDRISNSSVASQMTPVTKTTYAK